MGKVLMRPHLNLKIFWQLVAAGGTRVTFFLLLFTIYGCFNCTSVYQVCVCLVPMEARRGYWIPWDWNYRWLWAVMWVLGVGFGSFTKATSALNCWTISPAPQNVLFVSAASPPCPVLVGRCSALSAPDKQSLRCISSPRAVTAELLSPERDLKMEFLVCAHSGIESCVSF